MVGSLSAFCARGERPYHRRTGNSFDEIAPSHRLPQARDQWTILSNEAITAGFCNERNGV
jgi:hypothetical protein